MGELARVLRDEEHRVREEEASGEEEFGRSQPPTNPEPSRAFLAWSIPEELFVHLGNLQGKGRETRHGTTAPWLCKSTETTATCRRPELHGLYIISQ